MIEKRRYRKISVRIWGDERFRRLSKPKPNAQTLWLYMLTGPHTSQIPGLFISGEASLAEALDWPVQSFRRCFDELTEQGMALADWPNRLVWLPKAVRHNAPENPNVVKSWRNAMDELPECNLKFVAGAVLKEFIEGLGKGFAEGLGKGWPCIIRGALANQEQEQEQEQEHELTPEGSPTEGFADFYDGYPKKKNRTDAEKAWKSLRPSLELRERIMADVVTRAVSYDWRKDGGKFIPYPASYLRSRRWEDDEPIIAVVAAEPLEDWFDECRRIHSGDCGLSKMRHDQRKQLDEFKQQRASA